VPAQRGASASSFGAGRPPVCVPGARQLRTSALSAPISNGFGRNAQIPLSTAVATSGARFAQFAKRMIVFRDGKIRKDDVLRDRPRAHEVLLTMPTLED
jgi:hypothetical protein